MKHPSFYFKNLLRVIFLGACCILSVEKTWAIACNAIFTNGVQATSSTGNINLSYHSIITGGSASLATKNLTDNTSWVACSGASCAASGTAAIATGPAFLAGSTSASDINIGYQGSQTVTTGDFGVVTVGQEAVLRFNTAGGVYKTKALTTGFKSILELQSGDYWINGNLTIGQETILKRIASSGSTRIFVNGNVTMDFKVVTQNFTSSQLLIYATGSFTGANEVKLNAFMYAGGNVSLNFQSVINGAVSGANFTASGNEVAINYQPSALTTADFAPFCSGAVVAPVLLGSWRMDQLSWNGTAGEVIDSSGQNNHGRARIAAGSTALPSTTSGSPAYISGAQSTCRYGVFDGTTNGITRTNGYVELSGFPTLPNGFTFAAWIRSTNASAQHQRILVRDDADNGWGLSLADGTGSPELRFFNRNVTNNGAVTGQGVNPNCGVFCVDTNPVIASNTWYYVAAAVDTTAKTVTLYVYNQAGTLQAKAVGAYSGTWVDGTGTVAIGGETVNSSEGRQTSFHFLGNIDEVNMYSGALSQASIEGLLPSVRTCPAPDHYELDLAANSLACMGADVKVRACADSASPCTNIDYTVNGNVTLATTAGSLNSTSLTLASGTGTAKLTYPAAPEGTNATVTLSGEPTVATNARKCCTGSSCPVANSCSTTFRQAGFVFSATATGATSPISTQVAGTTSSSTYLRALQTNTATGACTARFTSPQAVKMAYKCVNPTTCISGQTFAIGSTANIQSNTNVASPILYSNVNLAFDANGSAPIPITYSDVGQIELLASLFLPAASGNPDYTLTGSTSFVVKPYTLFISPITSNLGTSATGTGFLSAGTNFQVKVEARNSKNNLTPNFGKEGTPETIDLKNLALVYPGGGNATSLTLGETFTATSPAGTFVNNKVSWKQVGSFTIQARLSDDNYLGAGDLASITTSPTIGRIYPDHFRLLNPVLINKCGSFTYMSQPMNMTYTLQAEATDGTVLSNYGGNYTTILPTYVAENADAGANLGSRFIAGASPTWAAGVFNLASTEAIFSRQIPSSAPEAPLSDLKIGLLMKDDLDFRKLQAMDMNAITTDTCGAACNAKSIGSSLNMRYGRLRLDDAFGPETVALPVNFVTEYWTGNYFSLNTSDSCTMIPRSAITYPNGTLATDTNRNVSVGGGTSQGNYTGLFGLGVQFSAGLPGVPDVTTRLSHYFTAPNASGRFQVGVNLTDLPWLRFDWNQDGNYSDVSLPNANIEFGSYRGNDRVIYWRERLQ